MALLLLAEIERLANQTLNRDDGLDESGEPEREPWSGRGGREMEESRLWEYEEGWIPGDGWGPKTPERKLETEPDAIKTLYGFGLVGLVWLVWGIWQSL